MSEQKRIAEDSTFQIACAMQHIDWLRSVLGVLRERLHESRTDKHYANVADLAIYNADAWYSELGGEMGNLEKRTEEAFGAEPAPQNATSANRGAEVSQ